MPHRIGKHEDIGPALTRLAIDDLAAARASLASTGSPVGRVHRVRQRLKRIRSVLRVLRPVLGTKALDIADHLRAAAQHLAETRATDAAVASARSLKAFAATEEAAGFDRVVTMLDRQARTCECQTALVYDLLTVAETEFSAIRIELDGTDLLLRAIDRAYCRGRTAMQRATFSMTTPDLHEWRKAVKDLWHLIRLSRKRLPPALRTRARRLEHLGETLGLDHDHAMLAERLALSPEGDPALMQQLAVIARQRHALAADAFALGARLYRDKPKKFRRRLQLS